ncbi:MAG: BTAD domain-containing putative transcriptional regulator [Thermoleophilia bacterium]
MPALPPDAVERPRLRRTMEEASRGRRILLVVAAAGAGKTTAAAEFLASRPGPTAWLALGEEDDGAGRVLTYLAAAVEAIDPGAGARARDLLDDGLSPADCAAILGESLPAGATLVIDDLHHAEAHAPVLRALRAFLDAVPDSALVVLVSRRLIRLDFGRDALAGRVAGVSDEELAFRVDEVEALLRAHGLDVDARAVAESSGGWAAGIVFDALRGSPSTAAQALPAGEDPFFAYLGQEVVDALPADLRDAVVASGLLDMVTAPRLAALLGAVAADDVLERMRRQHLPGTVEPEGLRYHPRFREYLVERLRRERPGELARLTARYARILRAEGDEEEAADHLIAAGELGEAEAVVEAAAGAVMRRGDWDKTLGWCAALGEERIAARPGLRRTQIRSLLMSRRQDEVATLVPAMRASGEFARLLEEAPDVAAWAVWALHGSGEWSALLELSPDPGSSRRARVIHHILSTGTSADPPPQWPAEDLDRVHPLHIALQSVFYYRGRFAEVERLSWAATERGPVTATLAEIYRIAVLRCRGDLAGGRAALDAAAPRVRASRFVEFWLQVEAELAFDEGDHAEGLRLIREARRTSREHGYRVADRAVFAAIEGRMLVRDGVLPEAIELLTDVRRWCQARGLSCFREWGDTWLAGALLGLGRDPGRARELLRAAVAGMRRAERTLELPAACVLLAEAEWRCGDEEAHDAAADAAYEAALATGTLSPLLRSLAEDAPEVLARRLDAAGPDDRVWRRLARAMQGRDDRTGPEGALLRVRTLGPPAIETADGPLPVSPAKAVELAAALARAGARGASRVSLAADLFEGSADAANYLRQLVHRLRRALPPGVALASTEGRLAWLPAEAVAADDQVLDGLLARAARQVGDARADTLATALELAERGPYLEGVDGDAVRLRRAALAEAVSDARRELARHLLAAGRATEATRTARAATAEDPYREDGWRLLMRCRAAAEGPPAAVPVYLECRAALREVGLDPSDETRELLARLRG